MARLQFAVWFVLGAVMAATAPAACAADLDRFLPKETDLVISLNVRQALDSTVVKENALDLIKATLASNKSAQEAIKALGLDPLTDFNRISVGIGLENVNNPQAVIVVDGKFDVRKIADLMDTLAKNEPNKFGVEKVSGKTVYRIATPDQPLPLFAAPVNATTLVFATAKELVVTSFDAANGTRTPEIKKEVADMLVKADAKSSLYLVAYTKGRLDAIPLPDPNLKKVIEKIHSITVDLKVEQDIDLELAIGTPSAEEAKKMYKTIADGLDQARVIVKALASQQPELQPLIDLVNSLTASPKANAVMINGKIRGGALGKLLKK